MNNHVYKLLSLLLIFININSYADDSVIYLEKGAQTPFQGYLFAPEREKELRLMSGNLDYYKSLTTSLQAINKAQEDSLNKYQEKIDLRDKRIDTLNNKETGLLSLIGVFLLGCGITTLLTFGVTKSVK